MPETHQDVREVDVSQLKRGIDKLLRTSEAMSIGNCVIATYVRINNLFDENKLSHVFQPGARREAGPGTSSQRRL